MVATLQRTVALADVHDVAVLIGENLQFDVLGIVEVTLRVDHRIFEVSFGFAHGRRKRGFHVAERTRDFEPLATAATGCLEREGQAVLACGALRGRHVGERFDGAGNDRHARGDHRLPRS
ncbi:MAG: hypothetical protein NVS2B8_00130 [Vulcanimicrobiaceae bacterium]